jgi:hypothetical protein
MHGQGQLSLPELSVSDRLGTKYQRAIAALLAHSSLTAASTECKVSERTLRRWLRIPEFREALAEAERDLLDRVAKSMTQLASSAQETLKSVLGNSEATDSVRIRAAVAILDHALRWREQVGLEDRLAALETQEGGGRHVR